MSGQLDLNKIHVLDGGMGSLIESLGYNCSSTAVWSSGANLTQPELVVDAHKKFIEAGANIILTNTYQANITRLSKLMSNEKALEFVNVSI
jgi:homocysteine S-methyltransferase